MKLTIHPGTCSLAPHILLHELNVPHEIEQIDLKKGEGRRPEFLAKNPMGQVPVLETDDGEVLTEVTAILLYLIQEHGSLDAPLHRLVRHLSFISTELHKCFYPIFFGKLMVKDEEAVKQLGDHFRARLEQRWEYIDELLPASEQLAGQEMGAADPYLYTVCRWWLMAGGNFEGHSFIQAFLENMESRDSVKAALKVEGLEPVAAPVAVD